MATAEKRTLEITAKVNDQVTATWRLIGDRMIAVGRRIGTGIATIGRSILSLRSLLVGFLGVLAVRRSFQGLRDVGAELDAILETGQKVNATVESIQELNYAAAQNGAALQDVTVALSQYQRNLEQARRGSQAQADAFRELGISLDEIPMQDGRLDASAALGELADGLLRIQDPTRRTAIMLTLLGESGGKLGPLLATGSRGIRENADELRRLSTVWSEEELQRSHRFGDSLTRLGTALRGLAQTAFLRFADRLTIVFDTLAATIAENKDEVIALATFLGQMLLKAVLLIGQALFGVIRLLAQFADWLATVGPQLPLIGKHLDGVFTGFSLGADGAIKRTVHLRDELERLQRVDALEPGQPHIESRIAEVQREIEMQEAVAAAFGLTEGKALDLTGALDRLTESFRKNFEENAAKVLGGGAGSEPTAGGFLTPEGEGSEPTGEEVERAPRKVQTAIQRAFEEWTNFADAVDRGGAQLIHGGLGGLTDAFGSIIAGTQKAREAFKAYGLDLLQTIAQLIPKLLLIKALQSIPGLGGLAGLADGGRTRGVQATIPLRTFADGGIARSPTLAIFGEAGEEAFVPLKHGRIPVQVRGGGGVVLNYQPVLSAVDQRGVQELLYRERETILALVLQAASRHPQQRAALGMP